MGLFNTYDLDTRFTLNSWKGTSKMRPCFASIKSAGKRVTDDMLYQQLTDARSDRNSDLIKRIMRDSVQILSHALKGDAVDVVIEEPAAPVLEAGEDFWVAAREVTTLMAARRNLTNVLFYLSIDADHLTVKTLLELLDHFAENPTEYLELCQEP